MNEQKLKEFKEAFSMDQIPLYDRKLAEPLMPRLWTESIPAGGYAAIKRKMEKVETGESLFYTDLPPADIMTLPPKERLKWEYRWWHLLRVQKRKSFWLEYSGLSSEELDDLALVHGYVFLPEIRDQKERRKVYNSRASERIRVPVRLVIVDCSGKSSEATLEELRLFMQEYPDIRKDTGGWHVFHIEYGRGRISYAVYCDSRERALKRLCYSLNRSITVHNYYKCAEVPQWVKKNHILGETVAKWRLLEGRVAGHDAALAGKVEDPERLPEKDKEMAPVSGDLL